MPIDSTPRMLDFLISMPPRPGTVVPGNASTPFMPARALGAPHTICKVSLPVSTVHTRSRSAFGCGTACVTSTTMKGASAAE